MSLSSSKSPTSTGSQPVAVPPAPPGARSARAPCPPCRRPRAPHRSCPTARAASTPRPSLCARCPTRWCDSAYRPRAGRRSERPTERRGARPRRTRSRRASRSSSGFRGARCALRPAASTHRRPVPPPSSRSRASPSPSHLHARFARSHGACRAPSRTARTVARLATTVHRGWLVCAGVCLLVHSVIASRGEPRVPRLPYRSRVSSRKPVPGDFGGGEVIATRDGGTIHVAFDHRRLAVIAEDAAGEERARVALPSPAQGIGAARAELGVTARSASRRARTLARPGAPDHAPPSHAREHANARPFGRYAA